jgi:hypothetical protein
MRASFIPSTRSGKVVAALLLWFVVVVAVWGVRPLTDHVPVECLEEDPELDEGVTEGCRVDHLGERHDDPQAAGSQAASCHSPISNDRSPRGEGLPDPQPGWAYERDACQVPVREATQVLGFNTVFVALGCTAALLWHRGRRRETTDA